MKFRQHFIKSKWGVSQKGSARGHEVDKTAAEEDKVAALNEQQQNENEKADLHKSCDFTLDNFDARQAALDQEMEGLAEAKSVMH